MAECNPPEPPPLLREPLHRFPTDAERNEAERRRWEEKQNSFWIKGGFFQMDGCGCLVILAISLVVVGTLSGPTNPLPWMASLAMLARAG